MRGKADQLKLTSASSLPANFLYALVHLTLRGFLFILKFLWHFERQKLKTCGSMPQARQVIVMACQRQEMGADGGTDGAPCSRS